MWGDVFIVPMVMPLEIPPNHRRAFPWRWLGPLAAAAAGLLAYLPLLPTTVPHEDAAEFITAAATLGVPHPSGYPLYVLFANLLSRLPVSTMAWRVSLLSSLAAAASLGLLTVIARALAERWRERALTAVEQAALVLAVLTLGLGATWWGEAVYAKPYALHILILLAAAVTWWRFGSERRWGGWAGFLTGLLLANHLFLGILSLPVLVFAGMAGRRSERTRSWNETGLVGGGLLAGLSPYLFLYWRGIHGAPYEFRPFHDVAGFLTYVFRVSYGDVTMGSGSGKAGLMLGAVTDILRDELVLLPLLVLALWRGLARQRQRADWLVILAAAWLLAIGPLIAWVRPSGWSDVSAYLYRAYGGGGLAAVGCLAAAAAGWLMGSFHSRAGRAAIIILLVGGAGLTGLAAWPRVTAETSSFAATAYDRLLHSLPNHAVLVVADDGWATDTALFTLAYEQVGGGERHDVTVVDDVGITPFFQPSLPPGYAKFSLAMRRRLLLGAALADPQLRGRPLFTTFATEGLTKAPSRSNGGAYLVRGPSPGTIMTPPPPPAAAFRPDEPALGAVAARFLYAKAAEAYDESGNAAATPWLLKAIAADPTPMSDDYLNFQAYRRAHRLEKL